MSRPTARSKPQNSNKPATSNNHAQHKQNQRERKGGKAGQSKARQARKQHTHANSCGPPQTCLLQWVLHSSCWPKRLLCTTVAAQGQAHQAPCRQAPPVLIPTVRHDLSFAHNRANPKLWGRLATKINISCYSCSVFLYLSSCCACSHVRS